MNPQYISGPEDRMPSAQFNAVAGDSYMAPHLGSTHSSPASFDDEPNMMVSPTGNWHQHMPSKTPATPSLAGSSATSSVATRGALPLQKRRRVTRACDECRRKKIKCDGKQPCTHCTVYSYECTYDQPSNRRRNPAPQYIEALENRLQRTEALLKSIMPDLDVNHPDFDPTKCFPDIQAAAAARAAKSSGTDSDGQKSDDDRITDKESLLSTMVEATGRLDVDESGHVDFHGHSSGLTYLTHLNHQFGGLLGEIRTSQSPNENLPDVSLLPPREAAFLLVETCLDKACVLMRFIHRPSFMAVAVRLYDLRPEDYDDEENSFLPLFYVAMAVGCLFVESAQVGVENTASEAMKYFNAGRRMIEMTDIRDMYSLQAVLLMAIYLQSSTRMSTCYSYVGIALSAAVRMGLHRAVPDANFNPIEREVRKRIFWTCWKMDTYVGAILGLPKGIAPEDIDQEVPVEVDDEYITKETIHPQPEGTLSTMTAANAHTRLLTIMAKTVKYIYPLKGVEQSVAGHPAGYSVSQTKLHEIEMDLQVWLGSLPPQLKPGEGEPPREFLKCQYLLKMSFAHVQMMLYRPFVHYISRPKTPGCDERPYSIASACVNVARKIVHTAEEMQRHGLLNGAYWFTIYTTFFSVITLVYYVMVNQIDPTTIACLNDARIGKDCLLILKDRSLAANRCVKSLEPIFEKIATRMNNLATQTHSSANSSAHSSAAKASVGSTTAPSSTTSSFPKKKRPRSFSHVKPEGEETSPATMYNSPATSSSGGSATHSPARRIKTSPSSPSHHFTGKTSCTDPALSRSNTFEMYQQSEFNAPKGEGTLQQQRQQYQQHQHRQQQQQQQSMAYQSHLSGSGLPDLNAMLFPSPDLFNFVPHHMDPAVQHYSKNNANNQLNPSPMFLSNNGTNPFGNLEGTILGPLPPYLLQGQQQQGDTIMTGQDVSMDGQVGQGDVPGQYFMGNGGGDAMVPDFFRDEWDDALMQQTFRAA